LKDIILSRKYRVSERRLCSAVITTLLPANLDLSLWKLPVFTMCRQIKNCGYTNPIPQREKLDTNGILRILQPAACGRLLYNAKNVDNYTVIPS